MLSAYLVSPGSIEIREVPIPEPGQGEIIVRIISALTCGTDLKAYVRGHTLIPMPSPFGHEFSGIVHSVGKGVTNIKEGHDIMSVHSAPCNTCDYCKRGLHNLCMNIMNDKVLGAFSEYIRIPEHVVRQNVFKKPENISFDEAAILEPLACVVHPYSLLHVEDIKNAVIIGAGPIGLLHVLFLKSKGIKAIVSDLNEERLKVARSVGADVTTSPDALENYVNHYTNNMGADLVVECTGIPHVWEKSVDHVRRGGTVILFGGCKAGTSVAFDTHRIHYDEITVKGSFHFTPFDVRYAYDLLTENILNVTLLISGSDDLKNIISVFQDLKNGIGIKYSIRP